MTDEKESKDRIPFESIDAATPISAWNLPDMASGAALAGKQRRPKPRGVKEAIEKVAEDDKPNNLTAEDLRLITEDARKEGFQQGLHEGTEQGIREGTKVGHKAGEQRAYAEAKADIEALQHQLRQISSRLFDPMQQQEIEIENIIVDLSLNLAKHLIHQEVQTQPHILLNIINKVLASMPRGATCLQVYLNDKDAALVESLHLPEPREWQIKRDNSLASGGCRIESEQSLVDYSVEERLAHYLEKIDDVDAASNQENTPPLENYVAAQAQCEAEHSLPEHNSAEHNPAEYNPTDSSQVESSQVEQQAASKHLPPEPKSTLSPSVNQSEKPLVEDKPSVLTDELEKRLDD